MILWYILVGVGAYVLGSTANRQPPAGGAGGFQYAGPAGNFPRPADRVDYRP